MFQLFSGSFESEAFSAVNVKNISTVITAPSNGWKTYVHTFQPKDPDYVTKYLLPLLKSDQYPKLEARLGLVAGGDASWWPKEDVFLISHRAYAPTGQAPQQITVKFVDRLWFFSKENRVAAWSGKISDIIFQMWKNVGGSEDSVIEPTAISFAQKETAIWYQAFNSYYDFIKSSLAPRAQNASGSAGYRLFVRDNVLHFHTQGYRSNGIDVAYTSGAEGFKELGVENRSIELSAQGSSALRNITYDPVRGLPKVIDPKDSALIKFASTDPGLTNVSYKMGHVSQNQSSQVELQTDYSFARFSNFQASLSFSNCLDVRSGLLLSLGLLEGNGPSINTGIWHVESTIFTVDLDALSGVANLCRGEYNGPSEIGIYPQSSQPLSPAPSVGTQTGQMAGTQIKVQPA